MPPDQCACDLRTRLVGDGCAVCNPAKAAALACDHPEDQVEVRRFRRAFGGESFRRLCLACGEKLDRRPLDPLDLPGGVLACDVPLVPNPRPAKTRGLGGRGNSKRRAYEKFMRSSAWRKQRERVLARDRYRCRCGDPATCVAHDRYSDPIERTPDRDMHASCDECNRLEREQRITRAVLGV